MTVKAEDFLFELNQIFDFAEQKKLDSVVISSGNLHRLVGDYPGPNHRIPVCCGVLRNAMITDDKILKEPPKGNGASLQIQFMFPRSKK